MSVTQKFAKGTHAWGYCGRSGRRLLLRDMVEDGHIPGLMVDPEFYEPVHPREQIPVPGDDPQALRYPAPRRDILSTTAFYSKGLDLASGVIVQIPIVIARTGPAFAIGVITGALVTLRDLTQITDRTGENVTLR